MPVAIEPIEIADLTTAVVDGSGVFDVLMKANKAHLEQEFKLGRLKGPEYATVYLGSLDRVMQTALQFLLQKDEAALKASLIEQQVLLAQVEVLKAGIQREILAAELLQMPAKLLLLQAQTALIEQQKVNLVSEELGIVAKTTLTTKQSANAIIEGTVLVAQECKLRAEFDLLAQNVIKAQQETAVLTQKVVTERAQTQNIGVDADSVIGRQKALYGAQTSGFTRDSELKVAKAMIEAWNVMRTTDETTLPGEAGLAAGNINRAVSKMLIGVGA